MSSVCRAALQALVARADARLAPAGLATTILAMHTFRAAQPALLYLSPACIVSVMLCALVRGESAKLWAYVDGEEEEASKQKEQ